MSWCKCPGVPRGHPPRECRTVSFEEQIMSKDKYASIFSRQMETIMFIILQIFYATRAVLKIGVYSQISPSFSWGIRKFSASWNLSLLKHCFVSRNLTDTLKTANRCKARQHDKALSQFTIRETLFPLSLVVFKVQIMLTLQGREF